MPFVSPFRRFPNPLFVLLVLSIAPAARAQLGAGDERKALARLEPAPLSVPAGHYAAPRGAVRIRFYVDDEYRSATPRAQERLIQQLTATNRVAERAFGIRFEIEAFKRWDRRAPANSLFPVLEELEKHDPGTDVDWVVALVAPLPLVSTSIHDLGMARTLGRHFVLRGMTSIEEMDGLRQAFPVLNRWAPDELTAMYSKRKQHKESVVFLHEWLHTLGGIHVGNRVRILCPSYSDQSSQLWKMDIAVADAALTDRLGARGNARGEVNWTSLKTLMAKAKAADWYTGEREELLAALAGGLTGPAHPGGKSGPAVDSNGPVQKLIDGVNATQALITGGDRAGALTRTRDMTAEAAKLQGAPPIVWVWLAQLHAQLGALTDAEAALARVARPDSLSPDDRGSHDQTRAALARTRQSFGLPAGDAAGIPSDAEPAYSQTFTAAQTLLVERKLPAARAAVEAALRAYPRAPGLALLSCEINLRQNRVREAGRRCDTALAAMDQLPRAHYLKAHVRMALGDHAGAVAPLRRALALDPEQAGYREDLIRLLRDLGRTKEAAAVVAERVAKPTATSATTSAPPERAAARPRRPFDAFAPPPPMP